MANKNLLSEITTKAIKYDELAEIIHDTSLVINKNIDKVPTSLIFVIKELLKIINRDV